MKIDLKKYAQAFYESVADLSGQELDQAINRFAIWLVRNGLANRADRLLAYFEDYYLAQQKMVKVMAVSPAPLSAKAQNDLTKQLQAQLDQEVLLVNSTDETLLAGLVLRIKDTLIDGSLKTQLQDLKLQLVK
ncbi:MAG: ATP synthase F1 subunit delta [bacterium]